MSSTGGTPPFTFELHEEKKGVIATQSTGKFYGLPGGRYYVRVTDSHGCNYGISDYYTVLESTPMSVNASAPAPPCAGDAVNVQYSINGGQAPFNASLSPAASAMNRGHHGYFTVVHAGSYSVNVIGKILITITPFSISN